MSRSQARERVFALVQKLASDELGAERSLRVFLFGSRARGSFDERSDFDIGIDAGHPLPLSELSRVREAFEGLNVLQRVDVVDFVAAAPEFRRIAERDFEVIYER